MCGKAELSRVPSPSQTKGKKIERVVSVAHPFHLFGPRVFHHLAFFVLLHPQRDQRLQIVGGD
jgi:hypothetical protein